MPILKINLNQGAAYKNNGIQPERDHVMTGQSSFVLVTAGLGWGYGWDWSNFRSDVPKPSSASQSEFAGQHYANYVYACRCLSWSTDEKLTDRSDT